MPQLKGGERTTRCGDLRNMESVRTNLPYKPIGDGIDSESSSSVQINNQEVLGNCLRRQYHGPGLFTQSRRCHLKQSFPQSRGNSKMVFPTSNIAHSSICPGQTQCSGGPAEPQRSNPQDRMDYSPSVPQPNLGQMGETSDRPICNQVQSETEYLRISLSRSSGPSQGCYDNQVVRNDMLCISSNCHDYTSDREIHSRTTSNDFNKPRLANKTLVSRSVKSISRKSSSTKPSSGRSATTQIRCSSSKPKQFESDRMALMQSKLRSLGVSMAATKLIKKAKRPSTLSVYSSR